MATGVAAQARIGFDAIRALRNSTGLGNYARGVLTGLHQAAPNLAQQLYSPRDAQAGYASLVDDLGATLHLPPRPLQRPLLREYWRTFRIGRQAQRNRVSLYHGLTHEIPRDLPGLGIPSVVTVHDLLFATHPELFATIDRHSYAWRYRWSVAHATAVVAVSEWTRQELHRIYAVPLSRIVVVPPARDPAFGAPFTEAARRDTCDRHGLPERFLVAVGTLEPRKNHRTILAALAQLDPATPPLVLIGHDGGSEAMLRTEVARLGLAHRVFINSSIPPADLPAILQSASLALYLSVAEGFGMPIVEAMSAGVPVIAAAGPHLREAGGEAVRYVSPHDPVELAAAMEELVHDRVAAGRLILAGHHHAARFDPVRLANRLLMVYDAVIARLPLPELTTSQVPSISQESLT